MTNNLIDDTQKEAWVDELKALAGRLGLSYKGVNEA